MPPKAKYTKEEIIETALNLAAEKGLSALTARELGDALDTSTRPVFTAFKTMDEVIAEVKKAALAKFDGYARKVPQDIPEFKKLGIKMVMFAMEEPELFKLTFMTERAELGPIEDYFGYFGPLAEKSIEVIMSDYSLDKDKAKMLFEHCWTYTYGISVMIASRLCVFTMEEVSKRISDDFRAMITKLKVDEKNIFPFK